ncbi:MAG: hypothetical protein JXR51_05040 [Bacteroidales bacterium]|nr:hypothetical protein [Bacteroidales bacterium]MBN2756525.1 hypothetical protein [Bacteroidales bacterium]
MKTFNLQIRFFLLILLFGLISFQSHSQLFNDCQNSALSGKYLLKINNQTTATLSLYGNTADLNIKYPDKEIISCGKFNACNNLINISFNDLNFIIENQPFNINNTSLNLPFKITSSIENGNSVWTKTNQTDIINNNNIDPFSGVISNNETPNNSNIETNNPNVGEIADNKSNIQNTNREISSENTDNEFIGDYIGTAWGWEVRFKHSSGDFVSQFTGTDKNELPFEGDKIIMSLMVEHATKFKIHIGENQQVTGEGEIVYNVIPNLCGLAILTEQVNAAVNLMSEFAFFFDLGAKITKKTAESFSGKFLGLQSNLAKNVKIATETGGNLINEYIGMKLPEKMKALDLEGQQSNALCNCASGHAAITAGNKIGPSTIKELINTTGIDIAKTIFMDMMAGSLPVGMVLSIPGVTQIQYEYKGLQNGPETRKFKIKGRLENNLLYLQMDGDVFEGSKNLTLQYTVNYKTEKPTFPTWTPFLKDAAKMQNTGSEATIYEEIEKTETIYFKDAATGETKSMEVPVFETIEKKEILPFPFAIYRETGKQRNGVKVWHEYEYNWSVYKTPSEN